jgi:cation transport regulator ChaB
VEGWGKIVAGVVIGVAGTVYATNEEVRKQLPKAARDLPDNVRRRFESAVSAAREASSKRREEILRDLAEHDAAHGARGVRPVVPGTDAAESSTTNEREEAENTEEGSR